MDFTNILIFEDEQAQSRRFLPLTYTRCLAELRSGAYSGIERVRRVFGGADISLHVRAEVKDAVAKRHGLPVNQVPEGNTLLLNARDAFGSLDPDNPPEGSLRSDLSEFSAAIREGKALPIKTSSGVTALWDILHANGKRIEDDAKLLRSGGFPRIDASTLKFTAVEKSESLYVHKRAIIGAGTVFDCSAGAIVIEEGATIMPHSTIIGPVVIGKKSIVKVGAKIYGGTTIGPVSKVGGEIENSIVQGYSNKQHDGYLGHSFLGEWCNLGAGTNTSDLKNDYSNVRVTIDGEEFDTGSMFVGLLMGDHTKSAIGTQFNTGTAVGVSSNIFSCGFPPKWIPNFSWCAPEGISLYRYEKAIDVAKKVMERRGVEMSGEDEGILRGWFEARTRVEV